MECQPESAVAVKGKTNIDRLSAMADAANQSGRSKARLDGPLDRGAPSEVRSLWTDPEAQVQAKTSLQRAMTRLNGNR